MELAKKENNKYNKKMETKTSKKIENKEPVWFNEDIEKEAISADEQYFYPDLIPSFPLCNNNIL